MDTDNPLLQEQTPPSPSDGPTAWGEALRRARDKEARYGPGWLQGLSELIRDMEDRDRQGIEKYGMPLRPDNGRDSGVDAYQEALDLVAYTNNEWLKNPSLVMRQLADDAMQFALRVKVYLMTRGTDGERPAQGQAEGGPGRLHGLGPSGQAEA